MGVINFPYNKSAPKEVTCVLCERRISLPDATIGPIKAGGEASLLCNGHLWDGLEFIDALADYMAGEREKLFHANNHNLMQLGASHVRTYTEQRDINGKNLLSWDLAHHLYMRSARDKIIVVSDKPVELLSTTRKQWFKLMRQVVRQRASTLNTVRSVELSNQISYMQGLRFWARAPNHYWRCLLPLLY